MSVLNHGGVRMKKRALSIVLTLALCLSLLPTAAWAEEPDPDPAPQEEATQAEPVEQDTEEQDTEEQGEESTENYVAQVGETSYAELKDALDAAKDGGTATLLDDASLGNQDTVYTLDDGESLTIDLDGHTLTGSFDIGARDGNNDYTVSNASLTMNDSSGDNSGHLNGWLRVFLDKNESCSNTLTVNGGTYQYTGEQKNFSGSSRATVCNVWGGTIIITGGEFKKNPNGAFALCMDSGDNKTDTVGTLSGGTFEGISGWYEKGASGILKSGYRYKLGDGTYFTYGSDVTYKVKDTLTVEKCTPHSFVDNNEQSNCTYCNAENPDGAAADTVAKVGDAQFKTLVEAINAANETDIEVRLVKNVAENVVVGGGTVTINLNGHTWEADIESAGTCIPLTVNGGNVTLKGGTVDQGSSGSTGNTGIVVSGGSLTLEENMSVKGGSDASDHYYAIDLKSGTLTLAEGVTLIYGLNVPEGQTLSEYLPDGTAFVQCDSDGSVSDPTQYITDAYDTSKNAYTGNMAVAAHKHSITTGNTCDCGFTCGHAKQNNDGQCTICGYQFAFKATDADGSLIGFYDKISDALSALPASNGTVTVLKDAAGTTGYRRLTSFPFTLDLQEHKLSGDDRGFKPEAQVTIKGGKDSQIDIVTANQYVYVTLDSTFQGMITTLSATDGELTVQPGCTAHVKKLESSYNSTKRIHLMGGSYDEIRIDASGLKLGDLLETGYRFENMNYSDNLYYNGTNLKVVPCTSHSYENGYCLYCNAECPHTNVNENNQCEDCKAQMVAVVMKGVEIAGYYDTLQAALDAAAGNTVKLLEDVTADAVTMSSPVTLDLNGKIIRAELTVTDAGAKLTDSVGNGGITKLTVAEGMNVASLLEEGFLFKNNRGAWVTDLTVTELTNVHIAEIPIRLGAMKDSYDVVYKAENKNVITLEVFAPESVTFGEYDLFLEIEFKSEDGTALGSGSTSRVTLDPDNKRAVFSLDGFLTSKDAGTYQCTIGSVRYHPSQTDAYTLTGQTFTVNVLQSGTEAAVETGISDSYFDQKDTFTYGERITVRAMFDPTGEEPAATHSMTPPTTDQCAVFNEKGEQVSEAKDVGNFSTWLDVLTTDLGVGTHNLTVRYLGGKNMEAASVPFTVTVNPCEITGLALDEKQLAYTGAAQTKDFTVTAGELKLTADDYDVRGNVQTAVGSYELTVTGKGNYTGMLTEKYTIAKAAAPEKATGAMTIVNKHQAEYAVDLAAMLPKLEAPCTYGDVNYTIEVIDIGSYYQPGPWGQAKIENGVLTLPIVYTISEQTGKVGEIRIKVSCDNYEDFELWIDVSAENKTLPTGAPTLSTTTITYGDKLSAITLSGGMKDGNETVPGTFTWQDEDEVLPAGEHQAAWRFVPTDDKTYAEVTGASTITVNKAAPTGAPKYTAITTSGKTLEDAGLTVDGGTFSVPGQVQWVDADGNEMDISTEVKANTAYTWKFVPDDENYSELTGSITLYAVSNSGGGGSSSGGSSGSSSTTTNPDGSTTKTEIKADGSVTETTTNPDGSTTRTETKADGSSVTEVKTADGTTATVKTDENGRTEASAKVSDEAVDDAKKSGEAVKIPTEVKAGERSDNATVVKIDLPEGAGETTVEIPVDNVTSGTVAIIVHEDGTEEIIKSSKPTENGLEFTIDGSTTVKIVDNGKHFEDTTDHWAKASIAFISARDLVSGVSDTKFAPDQAATRAQLWTILARMNGETVTGGKTWYELPQLWAQKNGVSDGTNPDGTITRAQMVTMLWRNAGSPTTGSGTKFTDVPADSYYAQAVAWAAANGITTGVGGGRFAPDAPCTRAQIATFLYQNMK